MSLVKGLGGAASGASAGAAFGPIGAGIGGVVGGIAGLFGGGDDDAAQKTAQQAADIIGSMPDLDPATIQETLQKMKVAGTLTPELENAVQQQASQMSQIKTNPVEKQAQLKALSQLQELGQTGLTADEKNQLLNIQRQSAQQNQSAQDSILAGMQARGQGGSGDELAARLMAQQKGEDMANQNSNALSAQANARALQAIMQAGNLGGQMQAQDFSQQAQQAQAQDIINQFNANQRASTQRYNVGAQNQAQEYNLNNAQNVANQNTGIANQQAQQNAQANLTAYQQNLNKRVDQANALTGVANQQAAAAKSSDQALGGVLGALPGLAKGAASYFGGGGTPANKGGIGGTGLSGDEYFMKYGQGGQQ